MSAYYDLFEKPDVRQTGEQQSLYARFVPKGTIDRKEFIERVHLFTGLSRSLLEGAMAGFMDELRDCLANGWTVELGELGYFTPSLSCTRQATDKKELRAASITAREAIVTEYSKPYTLVHEGAALAEAQSIEVSYNSNDKPVKTMLKGLSGFSDGAEEVSLNVRNAVPLAGFEVDFAGVFCMKHRTLAFTVREANAVTTFEGRIISVTSGSGVDAENAQTFQFHGKMLSRMVV